MTVSRGRRRYLLSLARQLLVVAIYVVVFVVLVVGFPLLALVSLLVDVFRPRARFVTVRLLVFAVVFLGSELLALCVAFWIWLRYSGEKAVSANYALQRWWSTALWSSMSRLFSLRFEATGTDVLSSGPYILLMRHASIVDTLVPSRYAANPFGIRMRYVLKAELSLDPALSCMDGRLPNYFVDRKSRDSAAEVANIRALAAGMTARDAVVIWPEGTRWTAQKWTHVLRQMEQKGTDPTLLDSARAMQRVMPPRPGGSLALLEGAPGADVVFCAHAGLEGLSTIGDIFCGGLVGSRVKLHFWRVRRRDVPADAKKQLHWLFEQWKAVDAFVVAHRGGAAAGQAGAR